eukprot:Hpha_TRINITY_DN5875_c0_g1::TRINITY_DN5875_c0_g1_i2::g.45571::m.45571
MGRKQQQQQRSKSPTGTAVEARQDRIHALHSRELRLSAEHPEGEELEVEDLVPESPGLILRIRGFLAPHECRRMRAVVDAAGLNPPSAKDLHPRKGEAFLCRESLSFTDPSLDAALWARLAPLLSSFEGRPPVGLTMLRYYRYLRGHSFGEHVDVSSRSKDGASETEYTLLLYLNSEGQDGEDGPLQGGETVFHKTKKEVLLEQPPEEGTLLLHAHGRRCLMHEGKE